MSSLTSKDPVYPQSILGWYDTVRSSYIDLVGDFIGSERFVIEGDSLLLFCLEDKRIDFDYGMQILHAVYVVERFLQSLVIRQCRFDIVFFEENADHCIPPGTAAAKRSFYLLTRSIIRKHLEQSLPNVQYVANVKSFTSLRCQEFKNYLSLSSVYLVLVHDGSSPKNYLQRKTYETVKDSKDTKKDLIGMIYYFSIHNLTVGLINMIEVFSSKIFTMIIESSSANNKIMLSCNPHLHKEMKLLLDNFKSIHEPDSDLLLSHDKLEEYAVKSQQLGIRDDYLLVTYAAFKLLLAKKCRIFHASVLILHAVILRSLPLSLRRFHLVKFSENHENEIIEFLKNLSETVRDLIDNPFWNKLTADKNIKCGLVDFFDGRLFRIVLKATQNHPLKHFVTSGMKKEWEILKFFIEDITNLSLSNLVAEKGDIDPGSFTLSEGKVAIYSQENTFEELKLLSFSNKIFDQYFDGLRIHNNDPNSLQCSRTAKIQAELEIRHSKKNMQLAERNSTKTSIYKLSFRLNQINMDHMMKYSTSLTGISGTSLRPEIITLSRERNLKNEKSSCSSPKANQIKAAKRAQDRDNLSKKALHSWQNCKKLLESISNNQTRYLETCAFLDKVDSKMTPYIEWDTSIYLLQSLLSWWVEYCEAEKKSNGYHVVALIWKTIRSICNFKSLAPIDSNKILCKICKILGIEDAWVGHELDTDKRKLSFCFQIPSYSKSIMIDMTQKKFQLTHCGPYMDRILDGKPDSRLPDILPDAWQIKVLDNLDSNNSVFVVAPTSAGKTFISFYAMKKILQADDKGVLVYVAPAKSVVTQIAAEIQCKSEIFLLNKLMLIDQSTFLQELLTTWKDRLGNPHKGL